MYRVFVKPTEMSLHEMVPIAFLNSKDVKFPSRCQRATLESNRAILTSIAIRSQNHYICHGSER